MNGIRTLSISSSSAFDGLMSKGSRLPSAVVCTTLVIPTPLSKGLHLGQGWHWS